MFQKIILPIIRFVVYTNIWVALAVVALCGFTYITLGTYDLNFLAFSFFATLLMYAYARWFDSPAREDQNTSSITTWTQKNQWLYYLSAIIGLLGTGYYTFQLNQETFPWLGGCAIISALYPLQFFKRGGEALRNIAGLKLFIIGAVWALVTTILPAAQVGQSINFDIVMLTIQRFFFVIAITIPFDIRDLRIDSPTINTLPYKYGVKRARFIALLFLLVAEIAAIVLFFSGLFRVSEFVGQIIAFEIISLFIFKSSPTQKDLYFSFGVESTSIILFLVVWLFNYFWP